MHLSLPEPYTGPVSFKMEFGDYEISVAFDALDRLDNCLPKCSICVFKNIENVTEDLFEVEEIVHQPVRKLSLGQRMRCEMIASLLHNPQVLFLDEPTIGMDIIVKKKIRELIRKLNKEEKITIVLTSHDMEDVEQICKRLIIISKGKIVHDGSMKDIREKYLSKKRIVVILQDKVKEISLPGAELMYRGTYKHALEINTKETSLKESVKSIVSKYNVEDISVLDPPIEEIIEEIYQR